MAVEGSRTGTPRRSIAGESPPVPQRRERVPTHGGEECGAPVCGGGESLPPPGAGTVAVWSLPTDNNRSFPRGIPPGLRPGGVGPGGGAWLVECEV